MGMEKIRLLACKSIYWLNMNAIIKDAIKHFSTCLEFQDMAIGENNTLQGPSQAVGSGWHIHFYGQ